MADPVSNEDRRPVARVKREKLNGSYALRRGGSVTLPAGASEDEIENALRAPAPAPEKEST